MVDAINEARALGRSTMLNYDKQWQLSPSY
jgi:hypothetical protein